MTCAPCSKGTRKNCCSDLGQIRARRTFKVATDPGRYVSAYAECVDDYFWAARRGDAAADPRTPAGAARKCKNDWRRYVSSRVVPLGEAGPEYRITKIWKMRDGSCEKTVCTPEGCEASEVECPPYCKQFGECIKPKPRIGVALVALGAIAGAAYLLTR
jgi:hypothetical protein